VNILGGHIVVKVDLLDVSFLGTAFIVARAGGKISIKMCELYLQHSPLVAAHLADALFLHLGN
jgi:hypothetical protein